MPNATHIRLGDTCCLLEKPTLLRRVLAVVCLATLTSCGGEGGPTSPTAPPSASPPQQTYTLSGTVSAAPGGTIESAIVRIVDSPNAGKSARTDGSGRYTIPGLQQAGFTVEATAPGYLSEARGVTLTGNATQNFTLRTVDPWRQSGIGNNVFDMPRYFPRVRIVGEYNSFCENFIVRIGGRLIVNEILGTCSVAIGPRYEGVHLTNGGVTEITNSPGVRWTFEEVR